MQTKAAFSRLLSGLLCFVLIAAMALTMASCKTGPELPSEDPSVKATVVGQGSKSFSFNVFDAEGNQTSFTVKTDKETVGEALLDAGLIAGEESTYGLYVKTVNGVTADYDVDKTYWAFYIDGEYAMTGVDATPVTEGAVYAFKIEK